MLGAAVQKVELVGAEPWWSQNSGSLFIGLAAIIAAGLAAYISIRNHNQQLAHDREVRDRDATRDAIDRAVEDMSDLILRMVILSSRVKKLERTRSSLESKDSGNGESSDNWQDEIDRLTADIDSRYSPIYASLNTMYADTVLLTIRLGKDHPISTAHRETRAVLEKQIVDVGKGKSENRTQAELEAAEDQLGEVSSTRTKFESACFSWLTSKT